MATSITNTSITTDNLTVDTNTIHVDSANNRVGIGTTSPTVPLQVAGDIKESVSGANAQISAITDGASNYATFTTTNGSRSYSMQIRPDQLNAFAIRDETGGGNRLLIDTSGYVTMPQQPHCMLYKSGNQAISAATSTNVTGWAVSNGLNSMHDSTNHRIVAPVAGTYIVGGMVQFSANGGAHIALLKNNAAVGNDSYLDNLSGGSNSYSMVIPMAQNDFVSMTVYMTTAANVNQNRTKLWLVKVS